MVEVKVHILAFKPWVRIQGVDLLCLERAPSVDRGRKLEAELGVDGMLREAGHGTVRGNAASRNWYNGK
jgi:hypothetical protein